MSRRYYTDDQAAADFVVFSLTLMTLGVVNLIKALRPRPDAYNPKAPDDPTHVPQLLSLFNSLGKIDISKMKPPQIDTSDPNRIRVSWASEDRPQWLKADEHPTDFMLPAMTGETRVYRLYPAQKAADPAAQLRFLRTLLRSCPRMTLELEATSHTLFWHLIDIEGRYVPQVILDHVRTYLPDTVVTMVEPTHEARQFPFYRQMLLFSLTNEYPAPLPFFGDDKAGDVLLPISHRLNWLRSDLEERVSYRLHTFTDSVEASNRGGKRLLEGQVKPTAGFWRKDDPLSGFDEKLLTAKLDEVHYHTFLSVTLESREEGRLYELAQIAKDVGQLKSPKHNGIMANLPKPFIREITTEGQASIPWFEMFMTALVQIHRPEWKNFLMVLTPPEIASLWHLPDESYTADKIVWAEASAPNALTRADNRDDTILLGDATQQGKRVAVFLPLRDRSSHAYIAGKTETGKSTLLHNLVHQDIAAGRGVVVLDPHGKLVDGILARSIPRDRVGDVVLLDSGNTDMPVPLNPFRIPDGTSFQTAFNYVYWVMRKIYANIWVDGQMDVTMRNIIQALLCDPQATPLDMERLFFDNTYRQTLVATMEDHDDVSFATLNYWRDFGNRSSGDRKELFRPIQNRTTAFLGSRALEYMTCHPNALNFRTFIEGEQIVLINLHGEAIRSEVGSLGAIFLSGLFLASESLPYLKDGQLPRMYVYVDEVERFVTTPLPDMFSQARKFGLSLTLANQFMGQLSDSTREGILGNTGTLMVFEVGPDDATKLKPLMGKDLDDGALLSLGKYRAVVKTRAHGNSQPAFIVSTRDAPERVGQAAHDEVALPDECLPKQAIKAWLDSRYRTPAPLPEVKPKTMPETKAPLEVTAEPTQPPKPAKQPKKAVKKRPADDGLADFE